MKLLLISVVWWLQGIFEPDEKYWQKDVGRERIYKTILDDEEFLNLTIGLILKG